MVYLYYISCLRCTILVGNARYADLCAHGHAYVHMCVHIFVLMYEQTHKCALTLTHAYMYTHTHAHMHARTHARMHTHTHTHTHVTHMSVCVCVCVFLHVCILCVFVHIICMHRNTYIYIRAFSCRFVLLHVPTHTHTHTHTQSVRVCVCVSGSNFAQTLRKPEAYVCLFRNFCFQVFVFLYLLIYLF